MEGDSAEAARIDEADFAKVSKSEDGVGVGRERDFWR
jgi:hypothetical protein